MIQSTFTCFSLSSLDVLCHSADSVLSSDVFSVFYLMAGILIFYTEMFGIFRFARSIKWLLISLYQILPSSSYITHLTHYFNCTTLINNNKQILYFLQSSILNDHERNMKLLFI